MNIRRLVLGLVNAMVVIVAGCAVAEKTASEPSSASPPTMAAPTAMRSAAPDAQSLNGWYLQGVGGSRLQPCGQSAQWPIGDKADLEARAKAFDLQDDTPVYVKLFARVSDEATHRVDVVRVEQFGSPEPVRDCGMTGVVMPAPGA